MRNGRGSGGKRLPRGQSGRIASRNSVISAAHDPAETDPRPRTSRGCFRTGHARARDADDGTVSGDQGRQPQPAAVLPDGRFLRAVLRGCRDRLESARHHADQARQASGPGHPDVRRAGGALRGLSAPADRAGFPRRGLRADGRPGRGKGARQQERGPPRRGAAGDAGHPDRRQSARCPYQQLPARDRARPLLRRRRSLRARLDRYLDFRIHRHGMRGRRTCRDLGADQSERSDRRRCALFRQRTRRRPCAN